MGVCGGGMGVCGRVAWWAGGSVRGSLALAGLPELGPGRQRVQQKLLAAHRALHILCRPCPDRDPRLHLRLARAPHTPGPAPFRPPTKPLDAAHAGGQLLRCAAVLVSKLCRVHSLSRARLSVLDALPPRLFLAALLQVASQPPLLARDPHPAPLGLARQLPPRHHALVLSDPHDSDPPHPLCRHCPPR
eukprot:1183202-Rhodomonas_salina.2